MAIAEQYQSDVDAILAHRHDNGADFWTTSDARLCKGSPFSTLESAHMLLELGVDRAEPVLVKVAELFLQAWRNDGRFRLAPTGAIYPCQTINAARLLCELGYAADDRLQRTFAHLLASQHTDGSWRCLKFSYGHGPETEFSNPGPTLTALAAFRHTPALNHDPALDKSVMFLLDHWTTRKPLGPCQYGIGTRFMQVAYPFASYNLFFYVHTLSSYKAAAQDTRFLEALRVLQSKMVDGNLVVERPNPRLAGFSFCRKGQPSELATLRYREIMRNLTAHEVV